MKATMGFLELAAALKFLSNVELVYRLAWLTKPVFLAIWFAIFATCSAYLLGWVVLSSYTGRNPISWIRRTFGLAMMFVAIYSLAAINGAHLGKLAGFLPPDPYPGQATSFLSSLDKGIAASRKQNKPIFINFTGITCTNCRYMEHEVFPDPAVAKELESFVKVELYTDDGSAENNANAKLREELTKASTNPTYVILTADKKVLKVYQGLAEHTEDFIKFLRDGKEAFGQSR